MQSAIWPPVTISSLIIEAPGQTCWFESVRILQYSPRKPYGTIDVPKVKKKTRSHRETINSFATLDPECPAIVKSYLIEH